jgi:hypothetical protein
VDVTAHRWWGDASRPAAPAPCDLLPRRGQRAAGCSAVRVQCSGWCGFAVAGRWSGALVAERRVQSRHTQRDARMGCASGRRACLSGGWVCGARWAMCSCEAVCVGMARGVSRGEKRVPHACLCGRGSRLAPAASAGQPTVCVRHTARRRLWSVCAAREAGPGAGVGEKGARRDAARARRSLPAAHRHLCACDRRAEEGARLGAKEMRVAAQPQVCGRGAYQRTKI